jgi:hypothetical protein
VERAAVLLGREEKWAVGGKRKRGRGVGRGEKEEGRKVGRGLGWERGLGFFFLFFSNPF